MTSSLRRAWAFPLAAGLALTACIEQTVAPGDGAAERRFAAVAPELTTLVPATGDAGTFLRSINAQLAVRGVPVAVRQASLSFTSTADPQRASIVFANDRALRMGYRFVDNDPRRPTPVGVVRQASFLPLAFAPTSSGFVFAKPAIDASFATWTAVTCSPMQVVPLALPANVLPSAILAIGGYVNDPLATDISTLGFLPGFVFDLILGPGASNSVLGVTFPFAWIDANGNYTDIDNDGNDDLAFSETWYNAAFTWSNTGSGGIDIETVALHENGHSLGLGHFGKIAVNTSSGKLLVSPRAVMNAYILGTLRAPLGTDNAAFCSLWGE